jgi:hypothetical protein
MPLTGSSDDNNGGMPPTGNGDDNNGGMPLTGSSDDNNGGMPLAGSSDDNNGGMPPPGNGDDINKGLSVGGVRDDSVGEMTFKLGGCDDSYSGLPHGGRSNGCYGEGLAAVDVIAATVGRSKGEQPPEGNAAGISSTERLAASGISTSQRLARGNASTSQPPEGSSHEGNSREVPPTFSYEQVDMTQ